MDRFSHASTEQQDRSDAALRDNTQYTGLAEVVLGAQVAEKNELQAERACFGLALEVKLFRRRKVYSDITTGFITTSAPHTSPHFNH